MTTRSSVIPGALQGEPEVVELLRRRAELVRLEMQRFSEVEAASQAAAEADGEWSRQAEAAMLRGEQGPAAAERRAALLRP